MHPLPGSPGRAPVNVPYCSDADSSVAPKPPPLGAGLLQSPLIAGQPSPPSPLSLNGRGGVGCVLVRNLPSPREGEGQGVRAGG